MRKTLPMIAASLFLFVVLSVVVTDSYPDEEESHTYDLLPDQEKVTYIQRDTRKGLSYAFYEKGSIPQMRMYIGTLQDLELEPRLWLKKRVVVESVIDLQKNNLEVAHARHRSPTNAFAHIFAGLVAYNFLQRKPATRINLERYMIEQPTTEVAKAA